MKDPQPTAIYLKDYQVPDFYIKKTDLIIDLDEDYATVTATLSILRNTHGTGQKNLTLDGHSMELLSVAINGESLPESGYKQTSHELVVNNVPDVFELSCVTRFKPQENTSLEGLYKSSGMYCTQCEAEGFRKITYYLDRPDVMSEFTTTIIADQTTYPILLANGNLIEQGEQGDGRHWAKWHDPFKKPAYLFAMVAGDLSVVEDSFITCSGREIALKIFVEEKDLNKCDHAMQSLKNSMTWDEEVYGREYDLDIFMIVAVDDFNMGAMENKGLNIFNTTCVLAHPKTTTDTAFQRVEAVVAHEYFHNWSGNRVTCRDWFQLSLKEGFTVFRDQGFSADMGSPVVKRVEDVSFLRTAQFAEDASPLAHPVQPPTYIEISNFYTLTIYEKGAEIVRMLHTLLGPELFRKGSDLYFERHDGQAVTINEFVGAMADVSSRELDQFSNWYTQAGTPILTVTENYNEAEKTYTLTFNQQSPDTPEAKGADKPALHIPIQLGLIGDAGPLPMNRQGVDAEAKEDNTQYLFELTEFETSITFENLIEKPVPSILQGFSAPVRLRFDYSRKDLCRLMQKDHDGFNRWEAGQQLAVIVLQEMMQAYREGKPLNVDSLLIEGLKSVLDDPTIDLAIKALMLTMPSEKYLAEIAQEVHVEAIHDCRHHLMCEIARELQSEFQLYYQNLSTNEDYQPTAEQIAKRHLKNTSLAYLMLLNDSNIQEQCVTQFRQANNMTDQFAALEAIVHCEFEEVQKIKSLLINDFYEQWKEDNLVMNQWFAVQASVPSVETLGAVKALMLHQDFSLKNPNKVRSLIGNFCNNAVSFHQASGEGYAFLVDQITQLNKLNPQIASRLVTPLTRWKKYPPEKQRLMRESLENILAIDDLSKDVYEVVSKSL